MSAWTDWRDWYRDAELDKINTILGLDGADVLAVSHNTTPFIEIGKEDSLPNPFLIFNTIKRFTKNSLASQVRDDLIRGNVHRLNRWYRNYNTEDYINRLVKTDRPNATIALREYLQWFTIEFVCHISEYAVDANGNVDLTDECTEKVYNILNGATLDPDKWYLVYSDENGDEDVWSIDKALNTEDLEVWYHNGLVDSETNRLYPYLPIKLGGRVLKDSERDSKEGKLRRLAIKIYGAKTRGWKTLESNLLDLPEEDDPNYQNAVDAQDQTEDLLIMQGVNILRDTKVTGKLMVETVNYLLDNFTIDVPPLDNPDDWSLCAYSTKQTFKVDLQVGDVAELDELGNPLDYKEVNIVEFFSFSYLATEVEEAGAYIKNGMESLIAVWLPDGNGNLVETVVTSDDVLNGVYDYENDYGHILIRIQTDVGYKAIRINELKANYYIAKDGQAKLSEYSLEDLFDPSNSKGALVFPLFKHIVDKQKFSIKYKIQNECTHVVMLYATIIELEWWQTPKFTKGLTVVLYIVAIIIAIYSVGTASEISAGLIALAETLVIALAVRIALKWVFEHTDNEFLRGLAVIIAVVIQIWSGDISNLTAMTGTEVALAMVNAINMYVNTSVEIDTEREEAKKEKAEKEYSSFMSELDSQILALEEESNKNNPIIAVLMEMKHLETPTEFYNRVGDLNTIEKGQLLPFAILDIDKLREVRQ